MTIITNLQFLRTKLGVVLRTHNYWPVRWRCRTAGWHRCRRHCRDLRTECKKQQYRSWVRRRCDGPCLWWRSVLHLKFQMIKGLVDMFVTTIRPIASIFCIDCVSKVPHFHHNFFTKVTKYWRFWFWIWPIWENLSYMVIWLKEIRLCIIVSEKFSSRSKMGKCLL